jgi:hypothetical protein
MAGNKVPAPLRRDKRSHEQAVNAPAGPAPVRRDVRSPDRNDSEKSPSRAPKSERPR